MAVVSTSASETGVGIDNVSQPAADLGNRKEICDSEN